MAGKGWKAWTREILTSADLQGYIQDQVVLRYASAAARATALPAPAEGMVSYLDDGNVVQVFDGAAWANVGPGGWATQLDTPSNWAGMSLTGSVQTIPGTSFSVGYVPAGRELEVDVSLPKLLVFTGTTAFVRLVLTRGAAGAQTVVIADGAEVTNGSTTTNLTVPVSLEGNLAGVGGQMDVRAEAWFVGGGGAAIQYSNVGMGPKVRWRVS